MYLSVLPVPAGKVAQLKLGMSHDQVRKLLGEPAETTEQTWTYAKKLGFGWVHVYFDENNQLCDTDPEPTEFYYSYPYQKTR